MIFHQQNNSQGNYNYNLRIYKDIKYAAHFHKNYEFIYQIIGTTKLYIHNRQFEISKGQGALVLSNQVHSFTVSPNAKTLVLVFSQEYVPKFASEIKGLEAQDPTFTLSASVYNLIREKLIDSKGSIFMRKACFYAICDEFYQSVLFQERSDIKEEPIVNILDWVSRNFASEISLADAAEKFGYEYHYLSRILNKSYNINFSQLVNSYRVEKAIELLQETDLSTTEIAYQSGFQSIRNFNYIFKNMIGKTPNEFRNK